MKNRWIVLSIGMLLFIVGYNLLPDHEANESHHFMAKIKSAKSKFESPYDSLSAEERAKYLLVDPKSSAIKPFLTEKRLTPLVSYPCSNCHEKPVKKLIVTARKENKKSHWNISLSHAAEGSMDCISCHDNQKMDRLKSLVDKPISMNESFKICAQCHSTQYQDWEGGAHGKSLNGWKTPRIIKTCVSCHDPHNPAFPSRLPARLNTRDLAK